MVYKGGWLISPLAWLILTGDTWRSPGACCGHWSGLSVSALPSTELMSHVSRALATDRGQPFPSSQGFSSSASSPADGGCEGAPHWSLWSLQGHQRRHQTHRLPFLTRCDPSNCLLSPFDDGSINGKVSYGFSTNCATPLALCSDYRTFSCGVIAPVLGK